MTPPLETLWLTIVVFAVSGASHPISLLAQLAAVPEQKQAATISVPLMAMLASGQLPVAIILTRVERQNARLAGSQRRKMTPPNLNTLRFRVDHRVPIGLNAPLGGRATLPIKDLEKHTKLFLSVSNMFLSPM